MKKTLAALMLMAGSALAAPVQFDTLTGTTSRGGFTMTDGVITGTTETLLYTHHSGQHTTNGSSTTIASTAVAITLNLSAIQTDINADTLTDKTSLITFDTNTDVGLYIQANGNLVGQWGTGTNGTAVAYDTWKANNTTFVNDNGDTCLTLAVVMDVTESWSGPGGLMVYDSKGNTVYSNVGLGSNGNTKVDRIVLNTKYITSALICTEVPQTGSKDWAVALIPEPSTATLSLLALCGLAARRRRK
ncbi:MAG: PEP-CTERM sorting domain-containing protein [Akkermansia sp.]|nr:PEP-CTERM sorting domain-containing protein [Akkermansia sp.]